MPTEIWPDTIGQACFDTWQDEVDVPGREEEVDAFAERWGGFGVNALKRMAQEGNETTRLFALFALGHLIPPVEEAFFIPFLSSPERKERWASAIGLGVQRNARVFTLLQDLLLEEIAYHSSYDKSTLNRVEEAVEEARGRIGNYRNNYWHWEQWADPAIVEIWQKEQAFREEYRWYTTHRLTITRLLDVWGDPRAIPALRHALSTCEEIEQHLDFDEIPINALIGWSTFLHLLRKTIERLAA